MVQTIWLYLLQPVESWPHLPEVSMSMDMLLLPLGTHEPYKLGFQKNMIALHGVFSRLEKNPRFLWPSWPSHMAQRPSHGPSWPPGTPSIPGSLRPCRFAGPLSSWREPWSQAGLTHFDMDCWDYWISTVSMIMANFMLNLWRIYGILWTWHKIFADFAHPNSGWLQVPDSAGIICWYLLPVQMYHHLQMSSKKRISKSPGTQDHTPTAVMASPQPLGWKIGIYLYTHTYIYMYIIYVYIYAYICKCCKIYRFLEYGWIDKLDLMRETSLECFMCTLTLFVYICIM